MQNEAMIERRGPKRGLTLGTKLILATIVLVVAVVGTSALYSQRTIDSLARTQSDTLRQEGEQALRERAELLVRNLASSAALSIAGSDTPYLKELVEQTISENPMVEWVTIIDGPSGQIMVRQPTPEGASNDDNDGAGLGSESKDELYDKLQAAAEADGSAGDGAAVGTVKRDLAFVVDPDDDTLWTFGGNARVRDGTLIGRIRLGMTTRELRERITASIDTAHEAARKSAQNQLLFAAIILLFGVLVAVLGSRRISQPLHQLSVQAEYIANGDFGQRVHVKSRDEIGQLANSFNLMAESLGVLLHEMANKAGLERELELARDVQETMSPPPKLHPVGDFSLTGRCEMAVQCGGDWWTYRQLSNGRLLVVVGDVTGHGLPAAMIAATARGAVEALSMVDEAIMSPPRLLEAIDRAIRDVGKAALLMTCFAVLLDPAKSKMFFANAGHTFPYLVRRNRVTGESELAVLAVRGNPLGDPRQCITADERDMQPDDLLLLSTDGLTDRVTHTGERFGEKRLRRILMDYQPEGSANDVVTLRDRIVAQVNDFGGQTPLDDDMTLIVCQYDAKSARRRKSVA